MFLSLSVTKPNCPIKFTLFLGCEGMTASVTPRLLGCGINLSEVIKGPTFMRIPPTLQFITYVIGVCIIFNWKLHQRKGTKVSFVSSELCWCLVSYIWWWILPVDHTKDEQVQERELTLVGAKQTSARCSGKKWLEYFCSFTVDDCLKAQLSKI